jgi:hypothetical protein
MTQGIAKINENISVRYEMDPTLVIWKLNLEITNTVLMILLFVLLNHLKMFSFYIFQFLVMEQNGMAHLIETIQTDMATLKIIKEGMTRLLQEHW